MQTARGSSKRCRLKKGQRCENCVRSKVACSGPPCARCFKLCLQCQPQCAVDPDRPFVDIAMSMLNTDDFSNKCIELLRHYDRQSCLDRKALYHLICSWRHMVRVWGAERTRGLCKAICNVFDFASDQMPGDILRRANPQTTQAMAEVRQQLMRTSLFTLLDDGVSVLMAETVTGTGVAFAMNSASKAVLCSVEEADELLERHQLLPIHLLTCMLDSEDHMCLLKPYFDLCSTARSNGCAFVKFCERDGTTDLHILRWRYMDLGLPDSPGSITIAFTLQRVPATRYLTRRPGHRHHWVERYMSGRQAVSTEGAAAASPSISMLPAMAIVPAFDVALDYSEVSASRRKLIMQWAKAPSPTTTAEALPRSPTTAEALPRSPPSISASPLTTPCTASDLDARIDSKGLTPLCWSSRQPSLTLWTHSELSASLSPSSSAHTSQVIGYTSSPVSSTPPPVLPLPAPVHLQRLPATCLSTLTTASPLIVPTLLAVSMEHEEEEDEISQAMEMLMHE